MDAYRHTHLFFHLILEDDDPPPKVQYRVESASQGSTLGTARSIPADEHWLYPIDWTTTTGVEAEVYFSGRGISGEVTVPPTAQPGDVIAVFLRPVSLVSYSFTVIVCDASERPLPISRVVPTYHHNYILSPMEPESVDSPERTIANRYFTFLTDGEGRANINLELEAPLDHVEFWVWAPGYRLFASGQLRIDEIEDRDYSICLERESRLQGQLVCADGSPHRSRQAFILHSHDRFCSRHQRSFLRRGDYHLDGHPEITLRPEYWPYLYYVETDDQGRFSVPGLNPGTYNVHDGHRYETWLGPLAICRPDQGLFFVRDYYELDMDLLEPEYRSQWDQIQVGLYLGEISWPVLAFPPREDPSRQIYRLAIEGRETRAQLQELQLRVEERSSRRADNGEWNHQSYPVDIEGSAVEYQGRMMKQIEIYSTSTQIFQVQFFARGQSSPLLDLPFPAPDDPLVIELESDPQLHLRHTVRVANDQGQPVEGARVWCAQGHRVLEGLELPYETTDSQGIALLESVVFHRFTPLEIWVWAPGYALFTSGQLDWERESVAVELREEAVMEGTIRGVSEPVSFICLSRSAVLDRKQRRFTIEPASLEASPEISVQPEPWPHYFQIVTDDQGKFQARGLAPDCYILWEAHSLNLPWQAPIIHCLPSGEIVSDRYVRGVNPHSYAPPWNLIELSLGSNWVNWPTEDECPPLPLSFWDWLP